MPGSPKSSPRAVPAVNRIGDRKRDFGDVAIGLQSLAGQAAEDVPSAAAGISANHAKVLGAFQPFVPYSGRYHYDVPGAHGEIFSGIAPESQRRGAAIDAESFMGCAVVVVKGKNG